MLRVKRALMVGRSVRSGRAGGVGFCHADVDEGRTSFNIYETLTVTVKTATRTEMTSNGHYYRYRWEVMPRLASRTLAVEYDEEMSWLRKDKKCSPTNV